jgi:hypothetical protein
MNLFKSIRESGASVNGFEFNGREANCLDGDITIQGGEVKTSRFSTVQKVGLGALSVAAAGGVYVGAKKLLTRKADVAAAPEGAVDTDKS